MNPTQRQETIDSFKSNPKYKQPSPTVWRVKVNGQFIATCSGKTVWKQIGHAKNAVLNHLQYVQCCRSTFSRGGGGLDSKQVMKTLIEDGTMELVAIDLGTNQEVKT